MIEKEIERLLSVKAVECIPWAERFYLSPIFTTPKKDGSVRMILNLKKLNENVEYNHFKMDTLDSALRLMTKDCFMASVDLTNAYHTIPMAINQRKFLQFAFKDKLYQYTCLPFGLSSAPHIFTKVLKPIFASLRKQGHVILGYLDDSLLIGESELECKENVRATTLLFERLGFVVHPKKSVLQPSKSISFLGFKLCSTDMSVRLLENKVVDIQEDCKRLIQKDRESIRTVAALIGKLVAACPGVQYGPVFYIPLEIAKNRALRVNQGSFEGMMHIDEDVRRNLRWWCKELPTQARLIEHGSPDVVLTTDASLLGWGAHTDSDRTSGPWSSQEKRAHINVLELKAIYFGLKTLCSEARGKHIRVRSDNTTAVQYVNKMGGTRSIDCNLVAREIWLWCIERNVWVSAAYVKGAENVIADRLSRKGNERTEWALSDPCFQAIEQIWGPFHIDLFASRLNFKVRDYVSWEPDPGAIATNAFDLDWSESVFYAFPPFSLVNRCVQKILVDRADGVLVVPMWPGQHWFPSLLRTLVDVPRIIPPHKRMLHLPGHPEKIHDLHQKLRLMVCHVSGKACKSSNFRQGLPDSSWHHGGQEHKNNTESTSVSGGNFVVKGKLVICERL